MFVDALLFADEVSPPIGLVAAQHAEPVEKLRVAVRCHVRREAEEHRPRVLFGLGSLFLFFLFFLFCIFFCFAALHRISCGHVIGAERILRRRRCWVGVLGGVGKNRNIVDGAHREGTGQRRSDRRARRRRARRRWGGLLRG